jgi:hypothetical protein
MFIVLSTGCVKRINTFYHSVDVTLCLLSGYFKIGFAAQVIRSSVKALNTAKPN